MDVKVNIGDPKTKKCVQKEIKDTNVFLGKKLGEKIEGDNFGFAGYEFEITGGSDDCGFPMRQDADGIGRRRILAVEGIGMKKWGKGVRQRKTVAGNTVHDKTSQINLKVIKSGKEPLFEEKKEEAKAEEKTEKKKE